MPMNRISTTAKGWTDNVTCHGWFTKTFIPQATARRANPEEPIVLVLDGHASHKTPEMLRAAVENNIELYFLPPHTTHQLQPLDVGIFGPLQWKWQARCDDIISETNAEVPRSQFIKEYMGVCDEVFTADLIKSAWRKSGMWPLNPDRFSEKDFAPSKLMSYAACLPPSFPEVPDAPDMLVLMTGLDGNEGVSVGDDGRGNTPMPADEAMVQGVGDSDETMDEEADNGDEMGERVDGSDEDDGIGESDTEDSEMTREGVERMNPDEGREECIDGGEVSGSATAGEVNMASNAGRSLRYERQSYRLKILIFQHLLSSPPSTPTMLVGNHEMARIADLEAEVELLRSQLEEANSKLEAALAHTVCAGWEIKTLKQWVNSKSNKTKRKVPLWEIARITVNTYK